ncbi:multidrug DMT transporter permease [Intrasporangium chromatireducens Q5-1]|uniref:Multidrug DMT transporter permease n=1 Tax=Intrasporangium chromatireducens Q5-1 TaxID=584657 RepID=W9GMU3_9MICO|nr:DMT family transporter [Intrasporangium chromatireducens]EWT06138.1 multidrug DMT transporter permease [Intrasporangium chromatireducens Q5-1]
MTDERARRTDRTWLIAVAASLWGLSAIWRDPLAQEYPSVTVVLWEHVVLVLLVSPWLVGSVRAVLQASWRTRVSVLVIGAGSSALATVLFTSAFRLGDPITPQVLQKLQPVIALVLAALLLGERLRRSFAWFAVPALVGAWLLSFPEPFAVGVTNLYAAGLALGAAALWAAGTVLGRAASAELGFAHVTALRFGVGLVALLVIALVTDVPLGIGTGAGWRIVVLAVVPGLLALLLYYRGLQATPASRATLAELAFPLTAALVGVTVLGGSLDGSQWVGFAVVLAAVVGLALHERRSERPAVTVSERAPDEVAVGR